MYGEKGDAAETSVKTESVYLALDYVLLAKQRDTAGGGNKNGFIQKEQQKVAASSSPDMASRRPDRESGRRREFLVGAALPDGCARVVAARQSQRRQGSNEDIMVCVM